MERSFELGSGGMMINKRRKLQHPHDRGESSEEEADEDEESGGAENKGRRVSVDEVEDDDDDDDLPPPVIHRWKLKQPNRVKEESTTVELAVAVPRKLRTAMSKRCRDSSSPNPNKPSSNGTLPPSNLSLEASLKSGKKTKSNNDTKPRQAKMVKISPSKQEVEVAETLYDLARMFVNQTKPTLPAKDEAEPSGEQNLEVKFEQAFTATVAPSSQSTEHVPPSLRPSVTATSSTSSIQTPEAPKRILCSTTKACGKSTASASASPCLSASSLVVTTEMTDAEQVQQHTEPAKRTPAIPLVIPEATLKTGSPSSPTDASETNGITKEEMVANNSIIIAAQQPEVEAYNHAQEDTNTKHSIDIVDRDCILTADSVLTGNVNTDETTKMLVQSPSTEGARTKKFQIDLMAAPEPNDCKVDEYTKCSIVDEKKKEEMLKVAAVAAVPENGFSSKDEDKNELEQKFMETKFHNEDRQVTEKGEADRCRDQDLEEDIQEVRESCQTKDFLREKELQDRDNQSTESGGKIIIGDSKPLKDGHDSALVPPLITRAESSVTSIPLTISLDVISWPSGVSNSEFYSLTPGADAASSHTSSLCVPILPSREVKPALAPVLLPPSSKMRFLRKHCTMHVYITHFIDFQQCLKQYTSRDSASRGSIPSCGVKRYNTNGSVAFPDGIFGNNKGNDLIGVSISNTHGLGTGSTKSTIDFIKERGLGPPVLDADDVQGRMNIQTRSDIDHLIKKTASQQHAQTMQQQTASPFQIGASFGLPVSQMDTASTVRNTTAGDIGLTSSISRGGSSMPSSNLSVGLSTGNASNIVPSHTQFLSPTVQHPTFPFSFPPSKVASSHGSNIPAQQAAHFFSNPLYGAQLAQTQHHSLQLQEVANMASRTTDPLKQQHQRSPSICSFASLGSLQQLPWPPTHGDRILIADQLQKSHQLNGKYSTAPESISSSETKMSAAPNNIYNPDLNSMQLASLNSPSQLLPTTMYPLTVCPQDLSLMGAIGGNQPGTLQQNPEMQVQPLHHMSQIQQHQQLVSPLHMSLKDADSRTSQSLSPMIINGGPSNAGVLELSSVSSVVAPQGHTFFHSIGNHNRISVLENSVSGQSQQQQQIQNQQHPTHMQILASRGFEDDKTNTSGGSYHYGISGYVDDKKGPVQYQNNHPFLGTSNCIQGSPTERTYNFTSNCSSPQSLMVTYPRTSVASHSASIPIQHPSHSSKKQMARSKPVSGSNISPSPVESTIITFSDRSPVHAANFANVSSMQGFPFTGQNVDAYNQCRSPGHSQQSAQMKVIQHASLGSPLHLTHGSPSQSMLAAMARTKGQVPNNEPSGLDNSRNSPAPSASSFSGTSLSHSPASTSGGAAVSKNSSAKDSYSNSHRQKSSSAATSGKKPPATVAPNTSPLFGANALYQHLPSNLQAEMVQNQARLQKKQPQKKQQRKQPKMSQGLPQQSLQYMVSPQQQPNNYHLQQTPLNQQSHLLPSHSSSQVASQNLEFGHIQQQPIKHIQYQQVQIQQQSPKYLQQHQQILSSPFGIVTNGVVPSVMANNLGNAARDLASDGALITQTGVLRPSTPMHFTLGTSVPSTSQRSSVSRPVILNSEDGSVRSDSINQQQTYVSFSNPVLQSIQNPGTPGKLEKSMTGH